MNGILIARFKVPAFVATLGVMYVVRGFALLMTNGLTYNNFGWQADLAIPASTISALTACFMCRSAC